MPENRVCSRTLSMTASRLYCLCSSILGSQISFTSCITFSVRFATSSVLIFLLIGGAKILRCVLKPCMSCFVSQIPPLSTQCKCRSRVTLMPSLSTGVSVRLSLFTDTSYECSSTNTRLSGLHVLNHGGGCVPSLLFEYTQLIQVTGSSTHVPVHCPCCPTSP